MRNRSVLNHHREEKSISKRVYCLGKRTEHANIYRLQKSNYRLRQFEIKTPKPSKERAQNKCALFSFYPIGKKQHQQPHPKSHKDNARGQRKTTRAKKDNQHKRRQTQEQKKKGKRTKREANTPQATNPPNHSRTQKPHKPRKAREQYKHTSNKGNPLKTPSKCE